MTVDWFTFAAQIVNFLILIWLLQRFLYGPVTRAMEERELRINERFAEADAAQERAEASQQDFERKHEELAQAKETLLARAGRDVDAWREEQIRHARADIDEDRRQWQAELVREKQALQRELQLDVTQHAVELGRHVLQELADQSLQRRLADRFISRLSEVDPQSLQMADHDGQQPLVVESSHELTADDQIRIREALRELNGTPEFRLNPQLICGIELQAPGCRLAWNLREALAEVESDLMDAVEETLPRHASSTEGAVS